MKSGPRLPQLEEALAQKRRPNTAKNKLINLKKNQRLIIVFISSNPSCSGLHLTFLVFLCVRRRQLLGILCTITLLVLSNYVWVRQHGMVLSIIRPILIEYLPMCHALFQIWGLEQ